jgi:replicative DNA helicase
LKRRNNLGLVIIDYLQLIEPEDKRANREQQIAQITRRLKGIAKENSVPLIALSQLNRGVELREDKRPRLADLRESGAIEQDADIVMFLHRPDAYNPEDRPGLAEIIVAKHRSGPTGIVSLQWRRESMRFDNYEGGADHSAAENF